MAHFSSFFFMFSLFKVGSVKTLGCIETLWMILFIGKTHDEAVTVLDATKARDQLEPWRNQLFGSYIMIMSKRKMVGYVYIWKKRKGLSLYIEFKIPILQSKLHIWF